MRQLRYLLSNLLIALLLAMLAPRLATADPIDRYIRTTMMQQHIPGLALAVIRDGRPVKVATYGLANVELRVPVTRTTVFRLASVSKQIIATGVMQLVADGKLTLQDPICTYLAQCPSAWRPITIQELLSHTSGLPMEAPGNDQFRVESVEAGIRRAYSVPLRSKPGERWAYSNLGYGILVEIIQKVSGRPWPDFFSERIFEPLGMRATRITSTFEVIPNRASGYLYRDDELHNVAPLIAMRPGGAFLSTLDDMIRWDAAVTRHSLLSKASQQRMWTAEKLSDGTSTHYGFGWWIDDVRGHRRIRHGGSEPGFRTEYTRFPDDHIDVIILSNGSSFRPDEMAVDVAGQFIHGLSIERRSIALTPALLSTYAGRYRLSPSTILIIGVDGTGLSIESSDPSQGEGEFHLNASAPDTFFISKDEDYVFKRSGSTVTELDIHSGDTRLEARRLP